MRWLIRLWHRQDGTTAVETAIGSLAIFLFLLGLVEFGRAYWNWNSLQLAAQEGARWAMVHHSQTTACTAPSPAPSVTLNSCSSFTNLANCAAYQTAQSLIGISASNLSVTVTCAGTSPTRMKVAATYAFGFVAAGLLPYGPINLTGTATVPLM